MDVVTVTLLFQWRFAMTEAWEKALKRYIVSFYKNRLWSISSMKFILSKLRFANNSVFQSSKVQ